MRSRRFFFPARVDDVARYTAQVVAFLGPAFDATLVHAAIGEALLNGILYGALGVSPTRSERDPIAFVESIRRAERRAGVGVGVVLEAEANASPPSRAVVTVRDPGSGFDWRAAHTALDATGEDAEATSGRGLLLMRAGASDLRWNDAGNEVRLEFTTPDDSTSSALHESDGAAIRARDASDAPAPVVGGEPSALAIDESGPRDEGLPVHADEPALVSSPPTTVRPRSQRVRATSRPPSVGPSSPAPAFTQRDDAKILVVDDVDTNRQLLKLLLESEGYQVECAGDGPTALARAAEWRPDLAIVDFQMPLMTGLDVVRAMGELGLLERTSVLLLTAAGADGDLRSAGIEAGACDFLQKPISRRELVARVSRNLATRTSIARVTDERDELHSSLTAAAKVIEALMPAARITCARAVVETMVVPCRYVGGDVVDFLRVGADAWAALLIDVAGHGLAAALTAAAARAVLRDRLVAGHDLGRALAGLNARLYEDLEYTGQHAAVAAVLVDELAGTVDVVNAGCPPIAIWGRDGALRLVRSNAPPAGILDDIPFAIERARLDAVARLVIVSDGVTEAFSRSSDTAGALTRLVAPCLLAELPGLPRAAAAQAFASLGDDRDDASVVWVTMHESIPSSAGLRRDAPDEPRAPGRL